MQRRRNCSWKRSALIVLCAFLALVLLLLVGATIWIEYMLGRIKSPEQQVTLSMDEIASILNETDATNPDFTGPEVDPDDVTMPQGPVEIIQTGEEVINILLVGQDTRNGHRAHSDAMILCTINKRTKTLTMTSFMRDMYLRIPGYGNQRINVAYLVGGFPMLDNTLKENFGEMRGSGRRCGYFPDCRRGGIPQPQRKLGCGGESGLAAEGRCQLPYRLAGTGLFQNSGDR